MNSFLSALIILLQIITNMSRDRQQVKEQIEIKQELSKFINLLQSEYKPSSNPLEQRRNEYGLSKKLSIILSASQPQSSSLDKQNSNPSANRSFQTGEKQSEGYRSIFHSLFNSQLNLTQIKLLEHLKAEFQQLHMQYSRCQSQNDSLRKDLASQKIANDEMLAVLMKLDIQQKELWQNYNLMTTKCQELTQKLRENDEEIAGLRSSLLVLQNDNEFMKKLIFHANENYEVLQKKCSQLEALRERQDANTDRKNVKRSSIDNLLKSAKTRKNGQSPARSEITLSPSIDDFQEIYRKMIVRTLKFKGRQQQVR